MQSGKKTVRREEAMNEEIKKNEISEEQAEKVSGGNADDPKGVISSGLQMIEPSDQFIEFKPMN